MEFLAGFPEGFLTADSLSVFLGAGPAVTAVTNSLCTGKGGKWPKRVGLVVSLVVAVFGVYASGVLLSWQGVGALVINGLILFAVAFGVGETLRALALGLSRTTALHQTADPGNWFVS